jgi:hypothetical protein
MSRQSPDGPFLSRLAPDVGTSVASGRLGKVSRGSTGTRGMVQSAVSYCSLALIGFATSGQNGKRSKSFGYHLWCCLVKYFCQKLAIRPVRAGTNALMQPIRANCGTRPSVGLLSRNSSLPSTRGGGGNSASLTRTNRYQAQGRPFALPRGWGSPRKATCPAEVPGPPW